MTLQVKVRNRSLKVLHFDLENRPLSYWYEGKATAEITVIAWSWAGDDEVEVRSLDRSDIQGSTLLMLAGFKEAYNQADRVTGHYVLKHDLPMINAMCFENDMPRLGTKEVHDTYLHLRSHGGLGFGQDAIAEYLDLPETKLSMPQGSWRKANRLYPKGVEKAVRRCVMDVEQHKAIYAELRCRDYLRPAKVWHP